MILLSQKLNRLTDLDPLDQIKDPEATANALNKLINLLKEMSFTAETHNIQQFLYYGGGINRVYSLLGDARLSRWLTETTNETKLDLKDDWKRLITFLEAEMKIQQQKMLIKRQTDDPPD